LETIQGVEVTQIPTVVHRILALHHPSLSTENPAKLQASNPTYFLLNLPDDLRQTFLEVLIDHLIYATAPPRPDFALADAIFPSILKLSRQYPTHSANSFKLKLQMMENNLQHGIASGSHHTDSKTFPGTSELALLRIIGAIWSTSDLRHPVGAPAQLLMGSYLELARVRSLKDLASGLFLVTLFSQASPFHIICKVLTSRCSTKVSQSVSSRKLSTFF
jgi:nucleolar protein 14